jgi:hypothetical protein
MAKSISQERRIVTYPDPKYHKLLTASSKLSGISISEQVGNVLRAYYDGLSDREREDLIAKSKNIF